MTAGLAERAGSAPSGRMPPLTIFVPHASDRFTNRRAHGDGLVAFEIAARLAQRGHTVHLASPVIDIAGDTPAGLHCYALGSGHPTSLRARLRYMRDVRALFNRLEREHGIDLVHQLNPVFTGISLALTGVRPPLVLGSFVADWPPGSEPAFLGRPALGPATQIVKRGLAALQQRGAAALLVTTPAARNRIVEPLRHAGRIRTLPHGIASAQFTAACGAPAPGTPPTIVFLGGIERRKGVFTLLEAFERVHAAMPAARLVIAGNGSEWGALVAYVRAAAHRESIQLLGVVDRARILTLMRDATVFCMPSLGEPFGMSLLEAMACAKPVVVSDAGGPAHIVDERGGRKVPPGSTIALAGALLDVLRDPELQAAMGAYNRGVVETTYEWDRVIDRLEATYAAVLAPAIAHR
jgi:glycosyltransferase involved in cell wall biosynthesis